MLIPLSYCVVFSSKYPTQTRCSVFQSNPILETFLGYCSSSGIIELLPLEDPGVRNQLFGILALVVTMVCHPILLSTATSIFILDQVEHMHKIMPLMIAMASIRTIGLQFTMPSPSL